MNRVFNKSFIQNVTRCKKTVFKIRQVVEKLRLILTFLRNPRQYHAFEKRKQNAKFDAFRYKTE